MACPGDTWLRTLGSLGPCGCSPPALGVTPSAPAGAAPRAGGSDSRPQKQFLLRFWCFGASVTQNGSSSLAYSSTSPTLVLKAFDTFQNETRAPSTGQEQSSHFKPGRPCTIGGLSDTINIRQTISNRGTFLEIQDFFFSGAKEKPVRGGSIFSWFSPGRL